MVFVLMGQLSFSELLGKASDLARHFLDSPRARIKQAPQAALTAFQLEPLS